LRDDLLGHGLLKTFPAGQTILTDKQYIDYIPLITRGGAKVIHYTNEQKALFLYFLQEGETCTMTLSSCLKRETSRVRAKTITETEIILVSGGADLLLYEAFCELERVCLNVLSS